MRSFMSSSLSARNPSVREYKSSAIGPRTGHFVESVNAPTLSASSPVSSDIHF